MRNPKRAWISIEERVARVANVWQASKGFARYTKELFTPKRQRNRTLGPKITRATSENWNARVPSTPTITRSQRESGERARSLVSPLLMMAIICAPRTKKARMQWWRRRFARKSSTDEPANGKQPKGWNALPANNGKECARNPFTRAAIIKVMHNIERRYHIIKCVIEKLKPQMK